MQNGSYILFCVCSKFRITRLHKHERSVNVEPLIVKCLHRKYDDFTRIIPTSQIFTKINQSVEHKFNKRKSIRSWVRQVEKTEFVLTRKRNNDPE